MMWPFRKEGTQSVKVREIEQTRTRIIDTSSRIQALVEEIQQASQGGGKGKKDGMAG